jgi:hypothetical protein
VIQTNRANRRLISNHFSVCVGNSTGVIVHRATTVPNNSTALVCQSHGVPFASFSLPGGGNTELELFAASLQCYRVPSCPVGFEACTLHNANLLGNL